MRIAYYSTCSSKELSGIIARGIPIGTRLALHREDAPYDFLIEILLDTPAKPPLSLPPPSTQSIVVQFTKNIRGHLIPNGNNGYDFVEDKTVETAEKLPAKAGEAADKQPAISSWKKLLKRLRFLRQREKNKPKKAQPKPPSPIEFPERFITFDVPIGPERIKCVRHVRETMLYNNSACPCGVQSSGTGNPDDLIEGSYRGAVVKRTRLLVRHVVRYWHTGAADEEILDGFTPPITSQELEAVREWYDRHRSTVDAEIQEYDTADREVAIGTVSRFFQ